MKLKKYWQVTSYVFCRVFPTKKCSPSFRSVCFVLPALLRLIRLLLPSSRSRGAMSTPENRLRSIDLDRCSKKDLTRALGLPHGGLKAAVEARLRAHRATLLPSSAPSTTKRCPSCPGPSPLCVPAPGCANVSAPGCAHVPAPGCAHVSAPDCCTPTAPAGNTLSARRCATLPGPACGNPPKPGYNSLPAVSTPDCVPAGDADPTGRPTPDTHPTPPGCPQHPPGTSRQLPPNHTTQICGCGSGW